MITAKASKLQSFVQHLQAQYPCFCLTAERLYCFELQKAVTVYLQSLNHIVKTVLLYTDEA